MLLEQIEGWGREAPELTAHRQGGRSLSYGELKSYSDALAVVVHELLPAKPKVPIVVYGHKQSEMLVLFLACVKAGYPYIPLDISIPAERLNKIIQVSGAKLILSPQKLPAEINKEAILCREEIHLAELSKGQVPSRKWQVGPDDVWYIIYTSGSTGEPKGVQITRRALESFVDWVNQEYSPREGEEVFLNQAPFSFDLSVMDLYMSLSKGCTLWSLTHAQIAKPQDLFPSLAESNLSYWVSTPSFAEICLLEPNFNQDLLPELRAFLFCGEVLPPGVAAKLLNNFPSAQVINLYGPTECTVAVTSVNITPEVLKAYPTLPIGGESANCRICICDPNDFEQPVPEMPSNLPAGEKGEIVIVGPNVSVGYLHRPELSRRAFFSWSEGGVNRQAYRTGDLGYWKDGLLFYLGRRDFQIKLHGYRIELGEIEEQLRRHSLVENCVVIPIERRGSYAYLQAYVKLRNALPESPDLREKLRKFLSQTLPAYMLPQRFTYLKQMPLTSNGKIDRKALWGGHYDSV